MNGAHSHKPILEAYNKRDVPLVRIVSSAERANHTLDIVTFRRGILKIYFDMGSEDSSS